MKMEVHFKTEGAAIAKAQVCKRTRPVEGPEHELVVTPLPAGFFALWDGQICSYGTGLRRGFELAVLQLF